MSDTNSSKTNFTPFDVGTVFNNLEQKDLKIKREKDKIIIKYPSRLEAMAIDPSKIAENNNLRYTPGQIDFCVKIFKTIKVNITDKKGSTEISPTSKRSTLIRHSAEIMRKALGFTDGLYINVEDKVNLRHCGLGSSSATIAGVACAINELYGKPVSDKYLVRYMAQNHGEEIDGDDNLINPVQCIGGSAACGMYEGGLVIIAGENTVVKTMNISDEYKVVIGIPEDFTYPDSKYLMDEEIKNLHKFMECGKKYGPTIAYRLFHECLPAMEEGDLKVIGDLIFDYRYHMGSIENCSFVYPPMVDLANKVAILKEKGIADVLTVSSVGPGMFAITKNPEECERVFKENNMKTLITEIHNSRYEIVEQ